MMKHTPTETGRHASTRRRLPFGRLTAVLVALLAVVLIPLAVADSGAWFADSSTKSVAAITAVTLNAPTDLSTSSTGEAGIDGVVLTWTPASITGASGSAGYHVYRSATPGQLGALVGTVTPASASTWTDTTAPDGDSYYVIKTFAGFLTSPSSAEVKGVRLTQYDDQVLADKPLAYWRLDDDPSSSKAQDYSGHGHDGTYDAGVTRGADPLVPSQVDQGTSAAFDGSSAVNIPDSDAFDSLHALTLEVWVKTPAVMSGRWEAMIGKQSLSDTDTQGRDWNLYLDTADSADNLVHTIHLSSTFWMSGGFAASLPEPYQPNTVHQIVATVDDQGRTAVYSDGVLFGSTTGISPHPDTPDVSPIRLGMADNALNGGLDDVAIYDHPLTADEIAAHYQAGEAKPKGPNLASYLNPSFEVCSGYPTNNAAGNAQTDAKCEPVDDAARGGLVLRTTVDVAPTADDQHTAGPFFDAGPASAGHTYSFRILTRGTDESSHTLRVEWLSSHDSSQYFTGVDVIDPTPTPLGNGWAFYQGTVTAPPNTQMARVTDYGDSTIVGTHLDLDDFEYTEVGHPVLSLSNNPASGVGPDFAFTPQNDEDAIALTPGATSGALPSGSADVPDRLADRGDDDSVAFSGENYFSGPNVFQADFTICVWFNTTKPGYGDDHVAAVPLVGAERAYVAASDFGFGIDSHGHLIYGDGNGTADVEVTSSGPSVADGVWHQGCVVRHSTTGHDAIYLDGAKIAQGTTALGSRAGNPRFLIGATDDPYGDNTIVGKMDQVQIYQRALSASEIAAAY